MSDIQQSTTSQKEPGRRQRLFSFQARHTIWLLAGLLEALLALRIFLKLIGANPANPFAGLLYGVTAVFLVPFAGMTAALTAGALVLRSSSVIAMVLYAVMAWVLERFVWAIFYRPRTGVANTQTTTTDRHLP